MRFVFIWEQRATCATYSINWLAFITEMKSVYCAVWTGSLNKAVCTLYLNNTEEAWINREQNNLRLPERIAEMTPEERIQSPEINVTHQKVSKTRLALRLVVTATGELRGILEHVHRHQLLQMEEICQFRQSVKWNYETANSCLS